MVLQKMILESFSESREEGTDSINWNITVKSYDEFAASISDVDTTLKKYNMLDFTEKDFDILSKPFSELSDAVKIYAIDKSNYFSCSQGRPEFGMVYKYKYYGEYGSKGMKTLLDNKAEGVCAVHASYESQIFDQLGIENYYESRNEINHAFTVVKVKNSKGKTLWIPFDYGIGPSEGLSVDEKIRKKYLKTEKMRYKLYLRGIKGAPDYKNFTDEDFN